MVHSKSYLGSLALLVAAATGKEMQPNAQVAAELYDSGVIHDQIMENKIVRQPIAHSGPEYHQLTVL